MSKNKFIDACLTGDVLLEDIEDYIDEWHESDSDEEIYEFLGMSLEEYGLYVENDYILKTIIHCREKNIPIHEFINQSSAEKLVARSSSPEESTAIKEWLRRKNKLNS
ncbi:hypothetical protein [Lysinibacillus cavernae]|uniref:hypothetical protein n=1 Tax=Lysinibacillus cavernae TaxID=2666135 RepID=UPI0012D8899A|nr:hypothetical protein [Lysinibacillus cavernae]